VGDLLHIASVTSVEVLTGGFDEDGISITCLSLRGSETSIT